MSVLAIICNTDLNPVRLGFSQVVNVDYFFPWSGITGKVVVETTLRM